MNHTLKNLFLLPLLIAVLGWLPTDRMSAQTLTVLHNFTNNPDGYRPVAVILSGDRLYGTASSGGTNGSGTLFALNTDGSGYTNLHSFASGSSPNAVLLVGNTLYGTTYAGNTVFAINTNGTGFTNLTSFSGANGAYPEGSLLLSGNTLYGTASQDGSGYYGTVFAVNTNGIGGVSAVYSFTGGLDGNGPVAGLILSGNTLYGTAYNGGSEGAGTVFGVNTDSTDFTNLHSFASIPNDGYWPQGKLVLSGNTLYGTAQYGGTSDYGTVFAINTDGTGFTNLYNFTGGNDGGYPKAELILSGSTLYGTAQYGGSSEDGTVFAVSTNGTGFTILHTFGGSDGASPGSSMILSGNILYGTTGGGGSAGDGTVFTLSLVSSAPTLNLHLSGTNVVVTWPTNAAGFTLESATNLVPPAIWITNTPAPVVVGTNNAVTNGIIGRQKFYRLSQ
jgi:uncharacterized repeat protein (TIGR03803 family)